MIDGLVMGSADLQALIGYLGSCYSIGLAVGICTYLAGYGVWMLIDMLRGGL